MLVGLCGGGDVFPVRYGLNSNKLFTGKCSEIPFPEEIRNSVTTFTLKLVVSCTPRLLYLIEIALPHHPLSKEVYLKTAWRLWGKYLAVSGIRNIGLPSCSPL
jgi:hypothetical protein